MKFSGSVFRIRIHWLRVRIHGFDDHKKWKKFTAEKNWSQIAIYLSLGLHKGRPSYRRSLQPSKENIQHFKTLNFITFFYFWGSFCPTGSRSGFTDLIESGSGSETLTATLTAQKSKKIPFQVKFIKLTKSPKWRDDANKNPKFNMRWDQKNCWKEWDCSAYLHITVPILVGPLGALPLLLFMLGSCESKLLQTPLILQSGFRHVFLYK